MLYLEGTGTIIILLLVHIYMHMSVYTCVLAVCSKVCCIGLSLALDWWKGVSNAVF